MYLYASMYMRKIHTKIIQVCKYLDVLLPISFIKFQLDISTIASLGYHLVLGEQKFSNFNVISILARTYQKCLQTLAVVIALLSDHFEKCLPRCNSKQFIMKEFRSKQRISKFWT